MRIIASVGAKDERCSLPDHTWRSADLCEEENVEYDREEFGIYGISEETR